MIFQSSSRSPDMKHMIVVLPGITGSVLEHEKWGNVWAPVPQGLFSYLMSRGQGIESLQLDEDMSEIEQLSPDDDCPELNDGVRATGLMPYSVLPGVERFDGYSALRKHLHKHLNLVDGDVFVDGRPSNYFEFPYDWRRDNRCSARELRHFINRELPKWQDVSPKAKVILIGHSMGGLVARYYLEKLGGYKLARALITFGTPYRGSPKALDGLANGYRKFGKELRSFTEMMRSFNSMYQLLPIYQAVKVGDAWQRVTETTLPPHIDPTRVAKARAFHDEINEGVEENCSNDDYDLLIQPVLGYGQHTYQGVSLVEDACDLVDDLPPAVGGLAGGDGTVPTASAVPNELWEKPTAWRPVNQKHSQIQNTKSLLRDLSQTLLWLQGDRVEAPQGPTRASEIPNGAGLNCDEAYAEEEPIAFSVEVPQGADPRKVTARVESLVGSDPSIDIALTADGSIWIGEVSRLTPGAYRLTVWPGESTPEWRTPLADTFEVVRS